MLWHLNIVNIDGTSPPSLLWHPVDIVAITVASHHLVEHNAESEDVGGLAEDAQVLQVEQHSKLDNKDTGSMREHFWCNMQMQPACL